MTLTQCSPSVCKPFDRSYVHLVDEIANRSSNDEGLRRLFLEYSQFDSFDYGELKDDLFVGLDYLEELDIRTSGDDSIGKKSTEEICQILR